MSGVLCLACLCVTGFPSDDPNATANSQQRHLARVAGTNTLHVVYTSDDNVMYSVSYDAGQSWLRPTIVGVGDHPALALNYGPGGKVRDVPWIVYRQNDDLKLAIMHDGEPITTRTLFDGNGRDSSAMPAAMIAEPLPNITDPSAWVTFEVVYGSGANTSYRIYAGKVFEFGPSVSWSILDEQVGTANECSQPSIAITPGKSVHVAWQRLDNTTGSSVWYSERTTGWSMPYRVSENHLGSHCPFVEASGDIVKLAWAAPLSCPDVLSRQRDNNGWRMTQFVCQTPDISEHPVLALKSVEAWQEHETDQYDIYVRISGEPANLSETPGSNSTYPSIDAVTDASTGKTTVFAVWTEQTPPRYEVRFATKDWLPQDPDGKASYYEVVTGESVPSDYCESRDSAVVCDSYALDFGNDSLTYRLPYLDPQYDYEVQFIVYHDSGGTWRQAVSVEDTLEERVSYRREVPETVVVAISPATYEEDAEVLLQNEKLRGAGCVVAELDVVQLEPAPRDSGSGGGPMSRNLVPIRARLYKPRPSVFADRVILSFALTRPGRADLRVYDVSGRVVARLLSRECGAGLTAVDWDGRDDAGVQLPLGTYFVRLATDAGASVEKVVLTR